MKNRDNLRVEADKMFVPVQKRQSEAFMFLMQCVGYGFSSRRSGRQLDQWEVFAMGYRDLGKEILGNAKCNVLAVLLPKSK